MFPREEDEEIDGVLVGWLVGVLLLEAEEAAGLYGKVLLGHEAADKGANGENSIRHKFHSMTIQ